MIAVFKVVFGFLFVCLIGGLFFYTIFDLKPWRRDSQLWDPEKGPGPVTTDSKKLHSKNFLTVLHGIILSRTICIMGWR